MATFFNSADEMKKQICDFGGNVEVWRGEDGSYAVGNAAEVAEAEEESGVEYRASGTVGDYR